MSKIVFLKKYWFKNKLLLSMGLYAYFLLILSYVAVLSLNATNSFWRPILIAGPIFFISFFAALILANQLLRNKLKASPSVKKSILWGIAGGGLTALFATMIVCFFILLMSSNFNKDNILDFFHAFLIYTLIASIIPLILGLIFGGTYGYLFFKRVR